MSFWQCSRLALLLLCVTVFAKQVSADQDEDPAAPEAKAPAEQPADETPPLKPDDIDELRDPPAESAEAKFPGQADLDEATGLKITARNFQDLARVIQLCESAIRKGLDEPSKDFASQLLVASRLERANRICNEIFDRKPPNQNWPKLAQVALIDLELSVRLQEDIAEAHFLIGRIHMLPGGNRKRAIGSFDKAIELAGEDRRMKARSLVMRGEAREDAERKLEDFNAALKLDPELVEAFRARGLFYMTQNKHKEALADFRSAVKLEPESARTQEALAIELLLNREFDEAKATLDRAIELEPDAGSAYAHRARLLGMQGKYDEAIADIDRALESAPDNTKWLLLRARIYQESEKTKKALADVERVLKKDPDDLEAVRLQATLLVADERTEEAVELLTSSIKNHPDKAELRMTLALLYVSTKQPRNAIEQFDNILEGENKHWSIYRSRADTLLSIGRQAEALSDYEEALKLDPKNGGVLNNLAWLLATSPNEKLRDGARAVKLATEACEVTEYKEAHILSTLAAAHAESGDFEAAVKWSEKAHDLGADELKEQLAEELESFRARKPWREVQNVEEEQKTVDEPKETPDKTDTAENEVSNK